MYAVNGGIAEDEAHQPNHQQPHLIVDRSYPSVLLGLHTNQPSALCLGPSEPNSRSASKGERTRSTSLVCGLIPNETSSGSAPVQSIMHWATSRIVGAYPEATLTMEPLGRSLLAMCCNASTTSLT